MITSKFYLKIVRTSAWYDLVATAGFMTPWSFALVFSWLQQLSKTLGSSDSLPTFNTTHILMVNMLGCIVVIWSLLRLRHTSPLLGKYDCVSRFMFAACQIYALKHGGPPVIGIFLFFELLFGILQALPITEDSTASKKR